MTGTPWRTSATEEALAFWRQHYAAATKPPPSMRPCPDAARAPHGCGLVRGQRVRSADGSPSYTWACTFCVDRGRSGSPHAAPDPT